MYAVHFPTNLSLRGRGVVYPPANPLPNVTSGNEAGCGAQPHGDG